MEISINLWNFCCPNENCDDYMIRGQGNIVVCETYGKVRRRLLRCRTCNYKFSERRSTLFFGLHTEESKIKKTIDCLIQGKSFRETASEVGIDKDTARRIWCKFVESCEESMGIFLKEFNIKLEDLIASLYSRKIKNKD